jgi:hypothetical protein
MSANVSLRINFRILTLPLELEHPATIVARRVKNALRLTSPTAVAYFTDS